MLLVVAGFLIFVAGDDGGDGPGDEAVATCTAFRDRIRSEYRLSFPEGGPLNEEAAAEYLSHAFADTMDELVAELRGLDLDGDAAAAVGALADRIGEVRAAPADFVHRNPLDDLADRFEAAGLAACGSELFGPSE